MQSNKFISQILIVLLFFVSCTGRKTPLEYALCMAEDNRAELEKVLSHYKDDPEKYAAAVFLIENMPAHISYRDDEIDKYYDIAHELLKTDLSHVIIRDSLLNVKKNIYPDLDKKNISDVRVISSDYLIYSIDKAFETWKNSVWAAHIDFDEFCETLLPYKVVDFQPFDYWRDTLSDAFSDNLKNQLFDDEECNTTYRTVDIVRNEMLAEVRRNGEYIDAGYPLLTATAMKNIAYGRCVDYVNLAVATYRSVGIPSYVVSTPYYGRFRAGHTWDVVIFGNGGHMPSEWDLVTEHGKRFFPAQRFPKVFRNTYAINRERVKYRNNSVLKYPFSYCEKDITDQYTKTSDIEIEINDDYALVENYCYISIFNGHNVDWSIVDYGEISGGKACFKNIGRNVLYIIQGFDGRRIVNISNPFILHQDGSVEYIVFDDTSKRSIDIRRKYYQNRNVVEMRQRLKGGKIQGSNDASFSQAKDLFVIDDVYIDDPQKISNENLYKYYRYLSPDGSYGSLAELKFYDVDTNEIVGKHIASRYSDEQVVEKAFDDDYLSNFETDSADGNWVGVSLKEPRKASFVRVIPRSDDNDIRVGDTYELMYYNGKEWVKMGKKVATSNVLHYDSVPSKALYWVNNLYRGWDERPFLLREGNQVEWR